MSFDLGVADYECARPEYPDTVIDRILASAELPTGGRILEIGPGPGKASRSFAARGFSLHGIEISRNMTDCFLANLSSYPGITAETADFDTWEPGEDFSADAILAATSFHWLDPATRYIKCARLLNPGGCLILLWNVVLPESNPRVMAAMDLIASFGGSPPQIPARRASQHEAQLEEIVSCGVFSLVDSFTYDWSMEQDVSTVLSGVTSNSSFLSLDPETKARCLSCLREIFGSESTPQRIGVISAAYTARKRA